MPTSVRLDPETEALLKRMARASGRSKSDVIREALHRMSADTQGTSEGGSLYEAIEDIVGIADAGPDDLAQQHKHYYRDKLERKRKK